MEEQVITSYILSKHHLLKGNQAKNVLRAVTDIIALHATVAGTPYLSLLARVENFQREHLDRELYVERNLVRLEAMRGTLFITPTFLAPVLYQATRISELHRLKRLQRWGIEQSEYQELAETICNVLKDSGKTLLEIKKALPKETIRSLRLRVGKDVYKGTNISVALSTMMREGIVISEKGAETIRTTRANRYVLFKRAYPNLELDRVRPEQAKAALVHRYVKAFGPVTEQDISWWTGFSKTETNNSWQL